MANNRIFIDANIVVYAVGVPHPLKDPCAEILRAIAQHTVHSVTSVEVLQEILHLYTRRGRRRDEVDLCREFSRMVDEVLPVTPVDFDLALVLHASSDRMAARDSLHAATMLNSGITQILSVDPHFDDVEGIKRIAPVEWVASSNL